MEKKKSKKKSTGKYITTHAELKDFTRQVSEDNFRDKKFKKAFDTFKTPVYGQRIIPSEQVICSFADENGKESNDKCIDYKTCTRSQYKHKENDEDGRTQDVCKDDNR